MSAPTADAYDRLTAAWLRYMVGTGREYELDQERAALLKFCVALTDAQNRVKCNDA